MIKNAPLANYKIFLDDERMPAASLQDAVICRGYQDFARTIRERGIPRYVTFDHDLGGHKTGKDCALYLVSKMMYWTPSNLHEFRFDVHSQNPVGARNIRLYLEQFIASMM